MEKIKINHIRLLIFLGILIAVFYPHIFLIIDNKLTVLDTIFFLLIEFMIFGSAFYYRFIHKGKRVLFSKDNIIIVKGNKEYKTLWLDLTVESQSLVTPQINLKNIKLSSLNNPSALTYMDLSWVTEESFFELCEKYAPPGHQMQKIVENQRSFKGRFLKFF